MNTIIETAVPASPIRPDPELETAVPASPIRPDPELAERALSRIGVARPYFDFDGLDLLDDGTVRALVAPHVPTKPESGAMTADQIARHLAILGSCAAALRRDDAARHHYLAVRASYERIATTTTVPITEPVVATAAATWIDKRTATATMGLAAPNGEIINRLAVTYAVMKPKMFERFNPLTEVPDFLRPPAPAVTIIEPGTVVHDYGHVANAMCAGHFPQRPAAPVALLMGRLVATAAQAMASHLEGPTGYRVEGGTVEATGLAQVGQQLTLYAQYQRPVGDMHEIAGQAEADGTVVGTVTARLSAVDLA